MTGRKVLKISYSLKCIRLYPRFLFSISVSSVDFYFRYRSPLL